jgi:hypothetical protein
MTSDPEGEPAVATIQPVAELFTGAASALWATTYNMDLALFNEFLLGRLGDPPLNIAVLADHRRIAASLERIPAERADTLAAVNRRWLLRCVRISGAFHPKSYLAVTGNRATLLVGSGNLSTGGLDDGREVFTTFRSATPVGDAAITAWRSWMRRLVGYVDDTTLAERFQDLESRIPLPPAIAPAVPSPLLHNLDTPIADQLAAAITEAGAQVEELWLAAPFYDADAAAAGALLDVLKPHRVRLFVTEATSVNGSRLAERLAASDAQVTVAGYDPDRFVHAKLLGIIADNQAWLLSGSANLSCAALTLTPAAHGNIELAVLAPLEASELRAAFVPPGTTTVERSLSSLTSLAFRTNPEPEIPAVRLISAAALADGRIEVVIDPVPVGDGWLLDDLTKHQPLTGNSEGRAVTAGPLPGRLVQLVDADDQVLSNRVVVDDPVALAAALTAGSARSGTDRPPEFTAGDLDTPLGQALLWLHRNLVMDVSERDTSTGAGGAGAAEADDDTDDALWDRLEREQLARDPRASTYERMWRRGRPGATEPIIEFLEALRARTPAEPEAHRRSLLARLLDQTGDDPANGGGTLPRRWKISTRIRVRARNVLRRWAAAQTDPRLMWVDPLAPAGNFAMIAATLAHLWLERSRHPDQVELTDDDLDDLWQRWLRPFAGTGKGDGWLDQLDGAGRALARDRLPDWLPEAVAALCWFVVRPGSGHRERVVAFQPVLAAALAHCLLDPTDMTARFLSAVTGHAISSDEVDGQILKALDFIDDALWCARTAQELGLDTLKLKASPGTAAVQVRLDVRGIPDPLLDARVPRLVLAARHYRRSGGVSIFGSDTGWRLAFVTDEKIAYKTSLSATLAESVMPLTDRLLQPLAAAGGVLADLFPAEQEKVA